MVGWTGKRAVWVTGLTDVATGVVAVWVVVGPGLQQLKKVLVNDLQPQFKREKLTALILLSAIRWKSCAEM